MDNTILSKIQSLERTLVEKQVLLKQYNCMLDDKKIEIDRITRNYEINTKSSELLVKFSSDMREVIGKELERLVTAVLQRTFDDRYSFKIVFTPRRGVVEADFFLYDIRSKKSIDIVESSGGTVADIVASILFFVLSEMFNPGDNYIIFDEIGKHISPDKRGTFFVFLKNLIKLYKKQIIYVTHQSELMDIADKVVELRLDEEEHVVCSVRN